MNLYKKYTTALSYLRCPVLLFFRIAYGYQFFIAGLGKLMNIEKPTGFFKELGIPFPQLNAYMAGTTECVGGALLLLGLFSRIITVPLTFTMLVALATAHRAAFTGIFSPVPADDGTITALPYRIDNWLGQLPIPYLLTALLILAYGPGRLSLDNLLCKLCCKKADPNTPDLAK